MQPRLINYVTLDSTNSEAMRLIFSGNISDSTVVIADYQDHGRGQGGNSWNSRSGENLLMSWIVFPAFLSAQSQFKLSKAVSLAILDMLEEQLLPCSIKWPNDIICNGSKIAGILIENSLMGSRLRHSIIGIGLNINQTEFPEFPFKATSMLMLSGKAYPVNEICKLLIDKLVKRYAELMNNQGQIDAAYLGRMYRLNEASRFSCGGDELVGVIRGVDEMGELLIEFSQGIRSFGFHQVKMVI